MTDSDEPAGYDLGTTAGVAAAKKAGMLPTRYQQPAADCQAQIARLRAEHWRSLASGDAQPMVTSRIDTRGSSFVMYRKRVDGDWRRTGAVRMYRCHGRQLATARSGQHGRRARRHAATSLRDDGDGPGGESDPEDEPWPWLDCAHLSAAKAQEAADRIAVACGGSLTPVGLRRDVEVIWPHLRGDAFSAALVSVYRRLPPELRGQHDRAAYAGWEGVQR